MSSGFRPLRRRFPDHASKPAAQRTMGVEWALGAPDQIRLRATFYAKGAQNQTANLRTPDAENVQHPAIEGLAPIIACDEQGAVERGLAPPPRQ